MIVKHLNTYYFSSTEKVSGFKVQLENDETMDIPAHLEQDPIGQDIYKAELSNPPSAVVSATPYLITTMETEVIIEE